MRKNRTSQSGLFNPRSILCFALCSAGVMLAILSFAASPSRVSIDQRAAHVNAMQKIAPWVLQRTATGEQAEFLVVLADQAPLDGARALPKKEEKGRYVRDALWNKAQATQAPILKWLQDRHIEHRSYYIVNMVWVKSTLAVAQSLAARPDVLRVEGNPAIRNNIPEPYDVARSPQRPEETAAIASGVNYTRAPLVWAMGYTGEGIVIAGADTGYRWDHNALKTQYRGWDGVIGNHDYNWHDSIHSGGGSCGANATAPCDDNGHGTHTMGSAVGDDGGANQIGMAPGAKWIGCRNMNAGFGTPTTYIECMEFFLAPYPVAGTPAQGDSSKAPHVTTNSWSCPSEEGCITPGALQSAVEAQRAAGIMMVAAAQNGGPNCYTIVDPPGIYDAAYTIGALNTGNDTLASFSSRGPITVDASNRLKPDLCAPGTGIYSSTRTTTSSYESAGWNGTSMATPHVAGAVALLWSAQPWLRHDINATETILNETAVHISSTTCSSSGSPNNLFGYGRLDIKAAVDRALFRSTGVSINGTAVSVGFYAVAGRKYRLERKLDMNGSWQQIGLDYTAGSTGPDQITDPLGGLEAQAFYHVILLP